MAIEIRELHIRATIEDVGAQGAAGNGDASAAAPAPGSSASRQVDMIVALCVEKVMEIMREREER